MQRTIHVVLLVYSGSNFSLRSCVNRVNPTSWSPLAASVSFTQFLR